MGKQEILNDETLMQRACGKLVEREVIYCVSTLVYDLRTVAEKLDDYDTYLSLQVREDWEEPVTNFIQDADLNDLETIADKVGYWSDVLAEAGAPEGCAADEWVEAHPEKLKELRDAVLRLITSADEFRDIGQEFNLDPDQWEIYEHWIVSSYLGDMLREHGHVVEDYMGMTIWGRPTTGQSILLDGVIRSIVKDLDDDHWIFWEDSK